jgi:hypothetical protein
MRGQEVHEKGTIEDGVCCGANEEAKVAARRVAKFSNRGDGGLYFLNRRTNSAKEALARFRETDAPRRPMHQGDPYALFKLPQCLTHCRSADA